MNSLRSLRPFSMPTFGALTVLLLTRVSVAGGADMIHHNAARESERDKSHGELVWTDFLAAQTLAKPPVATQTVQYGVTVINRQLIPGTV